MSKPAPKPDPPDAMPVGGVPVTHAAPYLDTSHTAPCGALIRASYQGRQGDAFSTGLEWITCAACLRLAGKEALMAAKKEAKKASAEPPLKVGDVVTLKEPFVALFRKAELYADLQFEEEMKLARRELRDAEVIWYCERKGGRVVLARPSQLRRLRAGKVAAA